MPHPASLKALPVAPFLNKSSTSSSKSDNWSTNTVISTPSTTRSQIPFGQKLIGMSQKSNSRINWLRCTIQKEDFTSTITKNLSNWEMKSLNYWAESFLLDVTTIFWLILFEFLYISFILYFIFIFFVIIRTFQFFQISFYSNFLNFCSNTIIMSLWIKFKPIINS